MQTLMVYVTFPDGESARKLAVKTVEDRLAACANIYGKGQSFFWWQGKIMSAEEYVCIFKTTESMYPLLQSRIVELHPYEVPCIVAVPIAAGYGPFLEWVDNETAGRKA